MLEVYTAGARDFAPRKLTDFNEQARSFTLGTREVISWKSQDGATIEGILIKPANFDASRKYPLLCIIHGGPTGTDRPLLLTPDAPPRLESKERMHGYARRVIAPMILGR